MNLQGGASKLATSVFLAFMLWQGGKYVDVPMTRVDRIWVSRSCAKNRSCDALAARGKPPVKPIARKDGTVGHPGDDHCLSLGATPRILRDSKRNEWNFCQFKDGTMIDSWALYESGKNRRK